MFQVGINTNNECGNDNIEILNNIERAGFKNIMLSYKTIKTDNIVKIIREKGSNISYYHIDNTCANDLWAVGDSAEDYIRYVLKEIAF